VHLVRFRSSVVTIRLEDEGGKVNPNLASDSLLRALLTQIGVDPETAVSLAAAIADWRTPGDRPRPHGAKAPQYAAAGRDYGPPGSPFRDVDELGAVLGMTPDLLARLRPHMTVYTESDPDGSTGDPMVAAALGDPARLALADDIAPRVVTVIAQGKGPGQASRGERVVIRLNARNGRRPYDILAREPVAPNSLAPP
jgi:general secretion pathway protein K